MGLRAETSPSRWASRVQKPETPLRSPHNSHLDVLARMGMIGLGIWISLWLAWFTTMIRSPAPPAGQAPRLHAAA